ncbi:unnamed protein product [Trichogramma brassicae]|uniref:CCHC-type domain-containing protein n=1 Tax=Trichogramma brassicae TaxID=86971 RepID=A0A6H5J7M2_9HYME|nr:unnamed protein product [Trichogramma brassicae]
MSQQQRLELCKAKRLCLNCLHKSHFVDKCPSASRCLICQAKHHTKLHADKPGRSRQGNGRRSGGQCQRQRSSRRGK